MTVGGIFARCIGIPVLFIISTLRFLDLILEEANFFPEATITATVLWGVVSLGAAVAWSIESYLEVKGRFKPILEAMEDDDRID